MWVFSKELAGNSQSNLRNMGGQYKFLQMLRNQADTAEKAFAPQMIQLAGNDGRVPQDVWRDMDSQAKAIMREPFSSLTMDLMALSKSLPIGKIVSEYRRSSDAGNTVSSISGQVPVLMDKTAYDYDGTVVPVHSTGYGREWRELAAQRSEGFDGLIDDNENHTRALRDKLANYIYNGDDSIVYKGYKAEGIKNSSKTKTRDLGASGSNINLTDPTTTGKDIIEEFKAGRDVLRITNNVLVPVTIYVSRSIMSNMERLLDTGNASNTYILEQVRRLEGVAAVKEDTMLQGNEYVVVALESQFIRPIVGMATGTYAVPRTMFNDNYNFVIANAVGLEIRSDFEGRSGVLYASATT